MELFQLMAAFIYAGHKLVHLDFSGCNLGPYIVEIGPAIAKSLTLQAVHLHQNMIPEEARTEFYGQLRIRHGAR